MFLHQGREMELLGLPVYDDEARRMGRVVAARAHEIVVQSRWPRRRVFEIDVKQIQAAVADAIYLSLPVMDYPARRVAGLMHRRRS
ncbi:MAG: hypothetical protein JST54_26745 [Deltaproteobacteria bacterium]|nr:hypothetical protein [Deltaproteobacteria bacterium]